MSLLYMYVALWNIPLVVNGLSTSLEIKLRNIRSLQVIISQQMGLQIFLKCALIEFD